MTNRAAGRGFAVYIAGTDTGIGKTTVATALLRTAVGDGRLAVGMKPVAAGCEREPDGTRWNADVLALAAAGNVDAPLSERNPYSLDAPIAPHIAAANAGMDLSLARICQNFATLASRADVVVVEGAGGVLVPLDDRHDMLDIPRSLGIPVILVVGIRLGCLNHALLSELAVRCRGVALAGWIANCLEPASDSRVQDANIAALAQRLDAPLLARLSYGSKPAHMRVTMARLDALRATGAARSPLNVSY